MERPQQSRSEELLSLALKAPTHDPTRTLSIHIEPAAPQISQSTVSPPQSKVRPTTSTIAGNPQATINNPQVQRQQDAPVRRSPNTEIAQSARTAHHRSDPSATATQALEARSIQPKGLWKLPSLISLNRSESTNWPWNLIKRPAAGVLVSVPSLPSQVQYTPSDVGEASIQSSLLIHSPQPLVSSQAGVVPSCITLSVESPHIYLCSGTKNIYMGKMRELPVPANMEHEWCQTVRRRLTEDLFTVLQSLPSSLSRQETLVAPELRMMGTSGSNTVSVDLQPTVLIRCGSKRCRKVVAGTVKHLSYLHVFSKGQVLVLQNAPRLASLSTSRLTQDTARIEGDRMPQPLHLVDSCHGSACGLRVAMHIAASNQTRICTIGGLVRVDDIVYGLTTAHSIVPLEPHSESDTRSVSESDSQSDSVFSVHSEESASVEAVPSRSSSFAPLCKGTDYEHPGTSDDRETLGVAIQALDPSTGPYMTLGPYSYGAQRHPLNPDNGTATSDFALIELTDTYRNLPNIYEVLVEESLETHTVTSFEESWSDSASDAVMIVCSQHDVRPGSILPGEQVFLDRTTWFPTRKLETSAPLGEFMIIIGGFELIFG